MSDALEWVTLFDRGTGGDAGRERVTKALGADHVVHHLHPPEGAQGPRRDDCGGIEGDPGRSWRLA